MKGKRMNVGEPARFLKGKIILNHNYAAFQNKFLKGLSQHHGETHVTLPGANFENKSFPSCFSCCLYVVVPHGAKLEVVGRKTRIPGNVEAVVTF